MARYKPKFSSKNYVDFFTPGRLTELADTIYSGKARKEYTGLSVDDLVKLPTLYGTLDPRGSPILELDDNEEFVTSNKKVVLGSDIKSITWLMYDKPRSAYVDYGGVKQVHSSIHSGAVPIPLLGYKRFRKLKYNAWRDRIDYIELTDDFTIHSEDEGLERTFRLDLLLGHTFASTKYNAATDSIEWNDKLGLIPLSTLIGKGYKLAPEVVQYFRKNIGKYKTHFAVTYGAASIDKTVDGSIDDDLIKMHNACSTPMKLMLSQRWCWYGNHRNDDMICDFQNWDNIPLSVDGTGQDSLVKGLSNVSKKFGIVR